MIMHTDTYMFDAFVIVCSIVAQFTKLNDIGDVTRMNFKLKSILAG